MKIEKKYNLAAETFFRVGGVVDYFAKVENQADILALKELIPDFDSLPKLVVGACSNILVSDKGWRGVVIKNGIKKLEFLSENEVVVGSGEMLPKVVLDIANRGLAGIEHLGNIPGTVGGGIRGNVEAYEQSISGCLSTVTWCDFEGKCRKLARDECQFSYRESIFKRELDGKGLILDANFVFNNGDKEVLVETIMSDREKRMKNQPTDWSCGCFFKNVYLDQENYDLIAGKWGAGTLGDRKKGDFFSAGMLIDKAGLKGTKVGGAEVSLKHANFIVNTGMATADDIYQLFKLIQKKVLDEVGIELENEVQIIGEF